MFFFYFKFLDVILIAIQRPCLPVPVSGSSSGLFLLADSSQPPLDHMLCFHVSLPFSDFKNCYYMLDIVNVMLLFLGSFVYFCLKGLNLVLPSI